MWNRNRNWEPGQPEYTWEYKHLCNIDEIDHAEIESFLRANMEYPVDCLYSATMIALSNQELLYLKADLLGKENLRLLNEIKALKLKLKNNLKK